jgi:hypothetical protein
MAQRVRHAIATTTEPDELLFGTLPAACAIVEFTEESGPRYVSLLKSALDELSGAYDALLERLGISLRTAFDTRGPDRALREELRTRARHLVEHVIDRGMRSFLLMAANEELEDREWLEAIATVLAQKPPTSWADTDVAVFESAALELARPFRRLELLHLQMATARHEGFSARRITLTLPDGAERSQLIWLEDDRSAALDRLLDQTLSEARRIGGSDADQGLLAILAQRVLAEPSATTTTSAAETPIGQRSTA